MNVARSSSEQYGQSQLVPLAHLEYNSHHRLPPRMGLTPTVTLGEPYVGHLATTVWFAALSNSIGPQFGVTQWVPCCVSPGGGEGSIRAQPRAIKTAKDRGEPFVFLYVADSSFLSKSAAPVVVDIKGILERMGRFPVHGAIERTMAEDVEARSFIRH